MGVRRPVPLLIPAALLVLTAMLAGCTTTTPGTGASHPVRTISPPPPAATVTEAPQLAVLLARPLRLAPVKPGSACPRTHKTPRSPVAQPADAYGLGTAPLFPTAFYLGATGELHIGALTPEPDGLYNIKVAWSSIGGHAGVAVVRVGRLDGAGRAVVRLYDDPTAARGDAAVFTLYEDPTDYPAGTYVPGPGCYAYQIDGLGFTEVVYFSVAR